jgi:hypothetical protein
VNELLNFVLVVLVVLNIVLRFNVLELIFLDMVLFTDNEVNALTHLNIFVKG